MKKVLVTGGAGFIGSHFVKLLLSQGSYEVVNLDALTYAADLDNLKEFEGKSPYTFVKGSINDSVLLEKLFKLYDFEYVINFAAESHVDRSIENPEAFVQTNVLGTQCLLNICKQSWQIDKGETPISFKMNKKFIQISTDEVYGPSRNCQNTFTELDALNPTSPYAASKASADMLVLSYYKTYGLPINITRCTNNYGPHQDLEKFIPKMITHIQKGMNLPIYGEGLQSRTWLYVEDHCDAIYKVMTKGDRGEIYNVSGTFAIENIKLAERLLEMHTMFSEALKLNSKSKIAFVADRLGHDFFYCIDDTKIRTKLGWSPIVDFEKGLHLTLKWYNRG